MTKHNAGAYFLFIILGVSVVALLVYAVANTLIAASSYDQRMQRAVSKVKSAFTALEKTTNYHFIDDPSASAEVMQKEKTQMQSAIRQSRAALNELSANSATLEALFYGGFIDAYGRATVLRRDAYDVLGQSSEAIKRYEQLVGSLDAFLNARNVFKQHVDMLNSIELFDAYAGRGAEMRASSEAIRKAATSLSVQANVLPEMRSSWSDIVASMNKAADDFDSLAYGLDTAIDAYIYDAVSKIEADGATFDNETQDLYASFDQKSRTIKDIVDLNEKLEPLSVSIANQE